MGEELKKISQTSLILNILNIEDNGLVIDKNHSKDYYIAKKQIESWPEWKQECAREFMNQFKIESNSVKDTQPILRKKYKIVGRKVNNEK